MSPAEQKMTVTDVKVEVLNEVLLESKENSVTDQSVMNLDEKLEEHVANDEIVLNSDDKLEEHVVNDEIVMNSDEKPDLIDDKCLEECVVDVEEKVIEKFDAEKVLEPVVESLCSDLDVVENEVPMEE